MTKLKNKQLYWFKISTIAEAKAILFNLGGHGHFNMQAYMDYQAGKLVDVDTEYSAEEVAMALAGLPVVG